MKKNQYMYQSFRNNRSSFGGQHRSFNSRRPYRGGGFNNFRKSNRPKNQLGNNPELFIKKAQAVENLDYTSHNSFEDFNLAPVLLQNIKYKNYTIPTPIQDQSIQAILDGKDLIGLANTGTGKTAAFLIPLINKLYTLRNQKLLIIVPTRELALQINDEFKNLVYNMHLYSTIVVGGANIQRQIAEIRRNPQVVIATPGRLKDLIQRRVIYLEDFTNIVLDEVDLMVDIGFISDVKLFISLMPRVRQSLFFSATIPPKVHGILKDFVTDPVTVSVNKQQPSENINQDVVRVIDKNKKIEQLHDLLIKDGFDKVLIFGRTKHGVEKLHRELEHRGFKVAAIHGNKKQSHRQRALDSFKRNEIQILLATDVASRGLDIDNVTHVINYELPETYEGYIHRIGRTGRAGKMGQALTFVE